MAARMAAAADGGLVRVAQAARRAGEAVASVGQDGADRPEERGQPPRKNARAYGRSLKK
jgi:hypothetical protein